MIEPVLRPFCVYKIIKKLFDFSQGFSTKHKVCNEIFKKSQVLYPPHLAGLPTSVFHKLTDNKRKHLERRLSASQWDALLMEDNRAEKMFHRDLTDTLRESTESMAQAMGSISESSMCVSNAFAQSM